MSDVNKKLVWTTQQVLKALGYEVKITHLYEMYSRVLGCKNWHTAAAKGINFTQAIGIQSDTDVELDTSDLSLDALPVALNRLGVSRAEYQELLLCADLQLHAVRIPRISKENWDYLLKLARLVLKAASPESNERSVH